MIIDQMFEEEEKNTCTHVRKTQKNNLQINQVFIYSGKKRWHLKVQNDCVSSSIHTRIHTNIEKYKQTYFLYTRWPFETN